MTPTPPPWDSPQVEMRKTLPNVFPDPMVRVNPEVRVGELARDARSKEAFKFIVFGIFNNWLIMLNLMDLKNTRLKAQG